MKLCLPLFIFMLLTLHLYSQCDSSFFRYTGNAIYDISFADENTVVAVGTSTGFSRSADGGKHWKNIIPDGAQNAYSAIDFSSAAIGYIASNGGRMFKTEDGGDSWFVLTDLNKTITDIDFLNNDTGFAVDAVGNLLKTQDGGRSWTDTSLSFYSPLSSVKFLNDSLGLISGRSNTIFKTSDGGRTWTRINVDNIGFNRNITNAKMITSLVGYGCAEYYIIKTTDGGLTWSNISNVGAYYSDIYFSDPFNGYVVGNVGNAYIARTTDGGATWQQDTSYYLPYNAVSVIATSGSANRLMIGGGGSYGNNGRTLLLSDNAGSTWQSVSANGYVDFHDVQFLNDSTGYIAGGSQVLKTEDYGETWKALQGAVPIEYNGNSIQGIYFLDSSYGYAVTDGLYNTSDGGTTWTKKEAPVSFGVIFDKMQFLDRNTGLLLNGGLLQKTKDGANTVQTVLTPVVPVFITDFTISPSSGKGFAVEYGGYLHQSNDFGDTWTTQTLEKDEYLTSVYFYNDSLGFIGTNDSLIFKTTDGGTTWNRILVTNVYRAIRSFFFESPLVGYYIADNNNSDTYVFKTTDGGKKWTLVNSSFVSGAEKISGFQHAYLAGDYGVILKTDHLYKPSLPGYITGANKSCVGETSAYDVPSIEGITYNWTLSGGGTSNSNNASEIVKWTDAGNNTLTVQPQNSCGIGPSRSLDVNVILFTPVITKQDSLLTTTSGLNYQWYLNGIAVPDSAGGKQQTLTARQYGTYTADVTSVNGCTKTTAPYQYTTALPVRLLSFSGTLTEQHTVSLNWSVTSETGTSYYQIERSSDAIHFASIGVQMAGRGDYSLYRTIDLHPLDGIGYYRVKIVDNTGVFYYSDIVIITVLTTNAPFIFPNPVTEGVVKITKGSADIQQISISDNEGRVIKKLSSSGNTSVVSIPLTVSNGIYHLIIKTKTQEYNYKLIVQRN